MIGVEVPDSLSLEGSLVSEKLDGVRARWTGSEFLSRNGNKFAAPRWFCDGLPTLELDGELWAGRGSFQEVVGIVRKRVPVDAEWRRVTFMLFDAPCVTGPFTRRLAVLESLILPDHVRVIRQVRCSDRLHLERLFRDIVNAGGEGLVARRSLDCAADPVIKIKPRRTAEALVTGHTTGKGRNFNCLGAIVCQAGGVSFRVGAGLSGAQRAAPPKIGALITYSFDGLTKAGRPRCPVFVGCRDYE